MKILKSNDGMTMVEVIIAFVIFMLSLVMVTVALQYAISTQARYSERKKWVNGYTEYNAAGSTAEFRDGLLTSMYRSMSIQNAGGARIKIKPNPQRYIEFNFTTTDPLMTNCSFKLPVEPAVWVVQNSSGDDYTYTSGNTVEIPIYDINEADYQDYLSSSGGGD